MLVTPSEMANILERIAADRGIPLDALLQDLQQVLPTAYLTSNHKSETQPWDSTHNTDVLSRADLLQVLSDLCSLFPDL